MRLKYIIPFLILLLFISSGCAIGPSKITEQEEPVKILSLSGSYNKRSEIFYFKSNKQAIVYRVDSESMPVFYVYIVKEGKNLEKEGGFPEVMITQEGEIVDSTRLYKELGGYYVEVISANCEWTVSVYDFVK